MTRRLVLTEHVGVGGLDSYFVGKPRVCKRRRHGTGVVGEYVNRMRIKQKHFGAVQEFYAKKKNYSLQV